MHKRIQRTIAYMLSFSLMLSLLPLSGVQAAEMETVPGADLPAAVPAADPLAATEPETLPEETLPPEESPEVSVSTEPTQPDPTKSETLPPAPEIPASTEPAEKTEPDTEEILCPTETTEPTVPAEATEPTEPAEEESFYPQEIPDDFIVPISSDTGRSTFSALRRSLPAAYDSREVGRITPVRDQRPWQLCWAFSALAVGESHLVSSSQTDRSVDLSEEHLGFYFHGDACDPLGYASGDGTYLAEDYRISGNNNKFTTFALANWVGGAAETAYPYGEDPDPQDRAAAMDDMVHLTNAFWINARDTDTIKNYIMQNGSVGLSIYYKESFLNEETAAYCNDQYTATNHAISVVGWDDHFPAEHFVTAPEGDGAWLCKNSLGTDFGQDGYFWLSYHDKAITHHSATAFVFEFESGKNYTWNYHHDGSFGTSVEFVANGGAIANVYTASGSEDDSDEQLQAIGLALADTDVHYSIQIYRDPADPADPTSGEPALTVPQTGTTGLCGFYTIRLQEPVTLRSGESFSVVITLTNTTGGTIRYFADRSYVNGSWIQFVSHAEPGESYAALNPGSWADLADRQSTARIKAYTVELDSRSICRLSFEQDSLLLAPGETFLQLPTAEPHNADPCILAWQSDNEATATVAPDGTVTAIDHGECTITAATTDGRVSASYKVRVKPKLDAFTLLQAKPEMVVGEYFTPEAAVFPVSAAPHYPLSLHSSDETVAAISGSRVYALAPGTAVITLRAEPYSVQYTLTVTRSLEAAQVEAAPVLYDGSPAEPSVSVILAGVSLEEGSDYTLRFEHNTTPGTGTVIITGTGSYSGTIREDFPITLPDVPVSSLQNEKKGIRILGDIPETLSGCYLYRQKNSGSWKRIKTISGSGTFSWLDSDASSAGAVYHYQIVPYVKIGKTTYKGTASHEEALCRLPRPTIRKITVLDNAIQIQWKKVSGADAYQIFRATDQGPAEFVGRVTGGSDLSFTDISAVKSSVTFTYSIIAEKTWNGQLSISMCSDSRSACRPVSPNGFTVVNDAKGIRLSWEPAPLATGYAIYRSTNGTKWSKAKTLSGGASCSWTDTSRSSGKQYVYRIQSISKMDGVSYNSAFSQPQWISRLARPVLRKITAQPQGFTVFWKRVPGADGYLLLRSDNGSAPRIIGSTDSTLQLTDPTATQAGVLYAYQVVAIKDVDGRRDMSAPASAKSACCLDVPLLHTPQKVSRGTLLQWDPVPLATGYEIYRSSNGIKWSKVKTVSAGTTGWTDTARTPKTPYRYRITAIAKLDGVTYKSDASSHVQLPD